MNPSSPSPTLSILPLSISCNIIEVHHSEVLCRTEVRARELAHKVGPNENGKKHAISI